METSPFLTIGIPTWSRAAFLKDNLLSLTRQITASGLATVEIFVSDNASEDETETLCRQLAGEFSFLRYHRNETNIGANANFEQVITMAKGKYVWLLGDDDLIVEGILQKVIQAIETHHPDIITAPAVHSATQQKATHLHINKTVLTDNTVFKTEEMIALVGKISGLIFKKQSVESILPTARKIILATRTPWPHIVWVILCLNQTNKKILLLPYGTNVLVNENWHNLTFTGIDLLQIHFINYVKTLQAIKPYIQDSHYQSLIRRSIKTRQGSLLKCVFYATWLDGYREMLKRAFAFLPHIPGFRNRLSYWVFLVMPLACPPQIRRGLFRMLSPVLYRVSPKMKVTVERIVKIREDAVFNASGKRGFNSDGL